VSFDRAAEYYDATRALPDEAMADLLGVLVPELARRQPCLEIGVGTGRIALPLHGRGIALAGMDIAEAMLRRLIGNAGGTARFPVLRGDATRLPLADASFGSVLAVHVLHLIPTWRDAVEEARRVLRPGGALIASFPSEGGHPDGTRPSASTPWAAMLRQAAQRHGVVRTSRGASDPQQVAAYLGHRAAARRLPDVRVTQLRTLGATLHQLEGQVYSWTWPYPREQVLGLATEIRGWAAQEGVRLEEEHPVQTSLEWWAFELAAAGQDLLGTLQGHGDVVRADELARLREGQPAQRGVGAFRAN
jgi:SAM-dependent methyltransferase